LSRFSELTHTHTHRFKWFIWHLFCGRSREHCYGN